jgi:hypothetical protein
MKALPAMLGAVVLLANQGLRRAGGETPGSSSTIPARPHYLLLDNRLIERLDNARLALGTVAKQARNPLFREDRPWEPRFDNLYANVLYDETEKLFKCWYSPFIIDKAVTDTAKADRLQVPYRPNVREMGVCYAVSRDGLTWRKPALGLVDFEGSKANNLVVRGPHGAGIFRDGRESDPQKRYKMFYQGMAVRFSPDGLHWSDAVDCPEIEARGDTHNNTFWSPELKKYVGITRLFFGQRIVGRTESPDFLHWLKAGEVLRGDSQNQTYAMPVFPYAGIYLGLVMILRRQDDRVHCELAWSPDTVQWNRIEPGKPFIPTSDIQGAYDWGCVYAAAVPIVRAGRILLYYGGSNGPHGGWREGSFCLATLRADGFAGYQPVDSASPAVVTIRPVLCSGKRLRITADARGGSVRVSFIDAAGRQSARSEPVTGEVTDQAVRFPQDVRQAQKGAAVRLRIEITRAKVYCFAFGD